MTNKHKKHFQHKLPSRKCKSKPQYPTTSCLVGCPISIIPIIINIGEDVGKLEPLYFAGGI